MYGDQFGLGDLNRSILTVCAKNDRFSLLANLTPIDL